MSDMEVSEKDWGKMVDNAFKKRAKAQTASVGALIAFAAGVMHYWPNQSSLEARAASEDASAHAQASAEAVKTIFAKIATVDEHVTNLDVDLKLLAKDVQNQTKQLDDHESRLRGAERILDARAK